MKKFSFKTIKSRFIFWFLVISLIPLFTSFVAIILYFTAHIHESEMEKLLAIRDLKVMQVNTWLLDRQGDAFTISRSPVLRNLDRSGYFDNKKGENQQRLIKEARQYFNEWVKNTKDYIEIFLLDGSDGNIVISSNRSQEGLNKSEDPYFTVTKATRNLFLKDVYLSSIEKRPSMAFAMPVFSLQKPDKLIAVVVLRISLENVLYPLLMNRIGLGTTGESLIVNREGYVLSELRHKPGAILEVMLKTRPATESSRGITNTAETKDYRGEPVIAAYAPIPVMKWGLIVKRDVKDMMSAIDRMYTFFAIITLLSIVAVVIMALAIARNMGKPIKNMVDIAQKIMNGDFGSRIEKTRDDEFGFLAKTINKTADALQSRILVQHGEGVISSTMIHAQDMDTFSTGLLQKLIELSKSSVGLVYVVSSDHKELVPLVSIGINKEALRPYDIESMEGDMGEVILKRDILLIQKLPPDSMFTYRNVLGETMPRELLYIPLSLGKELTAMVVLGTLSEFSEETLTIVKNTQIAINTAFANLQSNLRIRLLATELELRNTELQTQSERLQAQAEELQTQTEELQHQSTELQAQNVELEMQKKQVDDANRMKSEFLSNMSHELRTPLNSIMALSRVLNMQAKDKLTSDELNYLDIIERNGKLLLSLINDILDLSRIEAGKMDISVRDISLPEIADQIVAGLRPICVNKSIDIDCSFPENFPRIQSDEKKVYQIVQNIAGNAVKFTSKGKITIAGKADSTHVTITITDTGIGISKQDLPTIFDEFRQVDGSSSRSFEGSGLGLAIARRLAMLLGGRIYAESEPGKGSAFTILLPLKYEGESNLPLPRDPFVAVRNEQKDRTILIVDDEPAVINLVAASLAREGYRTVACLKSSEAVKMAEQMQPYAITLDVLMPEIDGWKILQTLKQNQHTSHIPVIMISVSPDQDTGFALGASGYLMKPIRPEILLREIQRVRPSGAKTIMVVDDNIIERSEVVRLVKSQDYQVLEAENGYGAMELLRNDMPDLILLDLVMPGMDGFELLKLLRNDPRTLNIPVIIISAKDLSTNEKAELQGKISSFLVKGSTDSEKVLGELTRLLKDLEETRYYPIGNKPRILIVDDNEIVILQIRSVLEPAGYQVDVAHGGEEALQYTKTHVPDGIILDLMMPKVDGFMVLDSIRSAPATCNIPVLILTAKNLTREDLARLKSNNIKQLLHKGDIDRQELLAKVQHMITRDNPAPAAEVAVAEPAKPVAGKTKAAGKPGTGTMPTVMLIEDNPDNQVTVRAVIGGVCRLVEASDGQAALELLEKVNPDLILLDMGLPKMDGLTVLRRIRENPSRNHIPVIALTAHAMKDDREKYLMSGCNDYISKPFDPDLLVEMVKNWT